MGGMLAARYALMYGPDTEALVLVNPIPWTCATRGPLPPRWTCIARTSSSTRPHGPRSIGLEDWKQKGVPYRSVDDWYQRELKANFEGMKKYQLGTYYGGQWREDYDKWVLMAAGMLEGEGRERVAWNQALTYDMLYTQPVVHEFGQISVPTTLLIGEKDNAAPAKDAAPAEVAKQLGNYPELGPQAAKAIFNAKLVTWPELGHSPQVQDPRRLNDALLKALPAAKG
ncbi:hypothetical protein LMG26686_00558 [Achromobacter mucicolens]|nr:hypothetical protein LMG26686_00558 [Achromobacter mucicolens]